MHHSRARHGVVASRDARARGDFRATRSRDIVGVVRARETTMRGRGRDVRAMGARDVRGHDRLDVDARARERARGRRRARRRATIRRGGAIGIDDRARGAG
jgi:hypothetical protein